MANPPPGQAPRSNRRIGVLLLAAGLLLIALCVGLVLMAIGSTTYSSTAALATPPAIYAEIVPTDTPEPTQAAAAAPTQPLRTASPPGTTTPFYVIIEFTPTPGGPPTLEPSTGPVELPTELPSPNSPAAPPPTDFVLRHDTVVPTVGGSIPVTGATAGPVELPTFPAPSAARPQTRTPTPAPALPTQEPAATIPPPATTALDILEATGQLSFDYPLELVLDRDEIIKLQIRPDVPLALNAAVAPPLAPARLLVETSAQDLPHKSITYEVPIYPVMSAEVITPRADRLVILSSDEPKQVMDPQAGNFWTWSVVAKQPGEYKITLRVFGYRAQADADPVRAVVDDTRIVQVRDLPFPESLTRALSTGAGDLFSTNGPIALLIGIGGFILTLLGYRLNRQTALGPKNPPPPDGAGDKGGP